MTDWHNLEADEVLAQLRTDRQRGLSEEEAARRLAEYGPNELEERERRRPLAILAAQFAEAMVVMLIVAAIVSFFIGDPKDTITILVIVVLNAALGFVQEYRAERALAALKRLAVPVVKVRREGRVREIPATELVPGDIVLLEAGARVPADGRLLEAVNLRIDESPLTGESVPVEKTVQALAGQLPVADQRNMAFMGTAVTYGRGAMAVVSTGMRTELGKIAEMLQTVGKETTPLQRRTAQLGKGLALAALALVALTFALGVLRGEDPRRMFLTAISLAVAAVPEGLPAVVTIALALGAQRMVRRNALIRRLPAVETLGSVTTICSDKTGTLTENRMTVTVLDVAGRTVRLEERLRGLSPTISPDDPPLASPDPTLALLLAGGALCNDAALEELAEEPGRFRAVGDPTEGALVVAAARLGLWKEELERRYPRVAEVPFTSERKRMTTVHRGLVEWYAGKLGTWEIGKSVPQPTNLPNYQFTIFTKGAVDSLLEVSDRVWVDGRIEPLDDHWRGRIERANERWANEGKRVLGVAFRPLEALPGQVSEEELERGLIFVGLVGMIDPPRPEVRKAVATCRTAGIRPVMITGDHPLTALHIARHLGIAGDSQRYVTGRELAEMSVEELEGLVEEVAVYARVSPEHKLKIVEALQRRGHIVAMTGDGVNDAPALKEADVGVAMGRKGTEVAKGASDIIVADDDFSTLVEAIKMGRTIYSNIQKFTAFLLSWNLGVTGLILLSVLAFGGGAAVLLPLQILFLNVVLEDLPAIALGLDTPEKDVMNLPPRNPRSRFLPKKIWVLIVGFGSYMCLMSLAVFLLYAHSLELARTMAFVVFSLFVIFNVFNFRSLHKSTLFTALRKNPMLLGAIAASFGLTLLAMYTPGGASVFKFVPISMDQWIFAGLVAFSILPMGELLKKSIFSSSGVKQV